MLERLCKTKSLLAAFGGLIIAGTFAVMVSHSALADDATPAATCTGVICGR